MLRLTPVVRNLIMINVMVYIAQMIAPAKDFGYCFGDGFPYANTQSIITGFLSMWNVGTECFKPYQLFTYMFVHGSFMHILFNMLGLAFLGPMLESFWDQKRFLLFYIITGIGAGVFNILINLFFGVGSFSHMMGASGAVYGLLTAFGIIFPNLEMRFMFLPIAIKAKYFVLILGSIAIYSGFTNSPNDHTAHFAHLGGIFVAILMLQFWKKGDDYR